MRLIKTYVVGPAQDIPDMHAAGLCDSMGVLKQTTVEFTNTRQATEYISKHFRYYTMGPLGPVLHGSNVQDGQYIRGMFDGIAPDKALNVVQDAWNLWLCDN